MLFAGCAGEHRAPAESGAEAEADHDAARPAADAGDDAAFADADASATSLADAGPNDGTSCTPRTPLSGYAEYTLELSQLCAKLAHDGRVGCPWSRRALAQYDVDCSPERTSFPTLRRHCGTDIFYTYLAGETPLYLTWTFDADSGDLIAATVSGWAEGFPCAPAVYQAGPRFGICDDHDVWCPLCEGGPERDAQCPRDVVEARPSKACEAPKVAPGCACNSPDAAAWSLPREGTPCGAPTACPNCQNGTCWAECVCAIDGVFRWDRDCTE
jgi:hypothetical protein